MAFYGVGPVVFNGSNPISNVTATNSVEIGTRIHHDGRDYVYVYNAGNSQAIPGHGVTVTGTSGYSVTISSVVAAGDAFVGAVHHATLTTGTYGWIVVRGNCKVKMGADSICSSGHVLSPGTDGVWTANNITTAATGAYYQGKCTVATASAGVGEAYINCLYG